MSVLLLWMGVHCTYAGQLQSSVIIIIRHAEKPDAATDWPPPGTHEPTPMWIISSTSP